MSTTFRPGGLTALAVLNFILCAFWLFQGAKTAIAYVAVQTRSPATHSAEPETPAPGANDTDRPTRDTPREGAGEEGPADGTASERSGRRRSSRDREFEAAMRKALREVGLPVILLLVVMQVVGGVLLLLSGIGYLKMHRVLGRIVGSAAAVWTLAVLVIEVLAIPPPLGGSIYLGTIALMIHPILSLLLLNTTFRPDFRS